MKSNRPGPRAFAWGLVWVLMLGVIVVGGSRIHFDVNPLRILPQSVPEVRGLTAYIEHFSRPDELILAIDGPDAPGVEAATAQLAAALRQRPELASQVIDQPPGEDDPQAMADLISHVLIHQDPAALNSLAQSLEPGQSKQRIQDTIERMTFDPSPAVALLGAYDPLRLVEAAFGTSGTSTTLEGPKFSSADGKLRLVYLWAAEPLAREDYVKLIAWTSAIREFIATWRKETNPGPELRIRLTGEPAIMSEVSGGMQRDLSGSGFSTGLLIALIFWAIYRRIVPLLALLAMLVLGGLLTFGLSGLLVHDLNAMNAGFGAILFGLTVDYGILIYQQNQHTPGDPRRIRSAVGPGIFGASTTTAAAFAALHAGSQPSLGALGSIVAIGTLVSAGVMLILFVPWMVRLQPAPDTTSESPAWLLLRGRAPQVVAALIFCALPAAVAVLWLRGLPPVDGGDRSTRPRNSEAYAALDDVQHALTGGASVSSLVVHAANPAALREELDRLQQSLAPAVSAGTLRSFYLPTALVPVTEALRKNAAEAIPRILAQESRLKAELAEAGFDAPSTMMMNEIFRRLERTARDGSEPPLTGSARWMMQRMISSPGAKGELWAAAGLSPAPGANLAPLQNDRVFLADWAQTTRAIQEQVPREFGRIFAVLGILVIILLVFTFRRWQEIVWVVISLALSSILTLGGMAMAGWSWNFVNAAAILICLGAGSDYSIHMLLALRESRPLSEVLTGTGQAIVVCALTSVVGFGSLAWASNLGLASLGQVCALALGMNCIVATYLLPYLWNFVHRKDHPST